MKRGSTWLIGFLAACAATLVLAPGCGSDNESSFNDRTQDGGLGDENHGGNFGEGGQPGTDARPCTGLCQQQVQCPNGGDTTVTGIVYDPAGKVPLYNVVVYVPNAPVEPIQTGASCDRCDGKLYSGNPLTGVQTNAKGEFKIPNMPVGKDIPLVIQLGKWRREIKIPLVSACTNTALADKNQTRLPRTRAEGNIPLMAITTGGADSMECLPLRMGIDISEFTSKGGEGRVHLYKGEDLLEEEDPDERAYSTSGFRAGFGDGKAFPKSTDLWNTVDALKKYDMVILSCEGGRNTKSKPPAARQALYDYESMGGRVFASHWHEYFFSEGPDAVKKTGGWNFEAPEVEGKTHMSTIRTDFPKGAAFADWLQNVKATTTKGQLAIKDARAVLASVKPVATEWSEVPHYPDAAKTSDPAAVQLMSYNAPIGATDDQVCGRAVFTDMHVSSGATQDIAGKQGTQFPAGCQGFGKPGSFTSVDLSPQEKALEFMLFDLSSCISNDHEPPPPIIVH
ncbi:carboxypeptidase-like regulatory domain-containing protein [Pendulispora rubella]|uniref:Carboxypeptidase-like regulatory domain-containing protein n=1 Tax=Pendulispora rubella TaxID=2741070 RepID=A0ABZ2KYN4_9BACT